MIDARLTKKYFMSLPAKVLLFSNVTNEVAEPIFSEEIAPIEKREEQWQRIVASGAAQRLFHICNTMDEWTSFLFSVKNKKKYLDVRRDKREKRLQ